MLIGMFYILGHFRQFPVFNLGLAHYASELFNFKYVAVQVSSEDTCYTIIPTTLNEDQVSNPVI